MPACNHDERAILAAELLVARRRIAQLEQAVESHGRIGQALGVVMCRYAIGADAAFGAMTRVSQHHNVKLRQLAEAVIDVVACRSTSIPDNLRAPLEDLLQDAESVARKD